MKEAAKKKTTEKSEAEFGVSYVAKALGTKPNLARIQLRNAKVKKHGKRYTWPTKSAADAVVKQLKAA